MLKVLIILLLVFCVLSLYNKRIRNYIKKISLLFVIVFMLLTNMFIGNDNVVNSKTYMACSYENEINMYMDIAKEVASKNGISVALLFAQAITEQGLNFNKAKFLFGIKAGKAEGCESRTGSDSGVTWHGCLLSTKEEINGKMVSTKACFRCYDSAADSIVDYGYWLTHNFKHRDKLMAATSLEEQVAAMNGYATSSSYCHSLVKNINLCNLAGEQLDPTSICGNTPITRTPLEEIQKEHFATSYGGDLKQGWLYLRTRAYEDPMDKYYVDADMLDDAIDEIFYRARLAYTANPFGFDDDEDGDNGELEGDNEKLCEDMKTINAGGVNTWRQGGKPWSKIQIGSSKTDTLSKWGCFATSIAIQIKRSGVNTGIENFNPGTFVCEMLKHGGFDSGARISPNTIASFIPGVSSTLNMSFSATQGNTGPLISKLTELMSQGHYPILWVNGSGTSGHYVAVTGVTADNVTIIDPSGRGTQLWPAYTKVSAIRSVKVN